MTKYTILSNLKLLNKYEDIVVFLFFLIFLFDFYYVNFILLIMPLQHCSIVFFLFSSFLAADVYVVANNWWLIAATSKSKYKIFVTATV